MNERIQTKSLSDELSGDVAVAILTRLQELNRDPHELLEIVRAVHVTLQDLSQGPSDTARSESRTSNSN